MRELVSQPMNPEGKELKEWVLEGSKLDPGD